MKNLVSNIFTFSLMFFFTVTGSSILFGQAGPMATPVPADKVIEIDEWVSFSTTIHDFGEITQNEPVEATFLVTNESDQPIVITNVKTTCGCTVPNFDSEPIKPGGTTEITATYNAKKAGAFTKPVKVYTDKSEDPYVLKITGIVVN